MKNVLLFPGQGSQHVGMGKDLYDQHACYQRTLDEACEVLGLPLKRWMHDGPLDTLTLTQNAQPAILAHSVGVLRLYQEQNSNLKFDLALGHSLGEYSALVASEVLSFADAIKLVHLRGLYMQEAVSPSMGSMAAILGAKDEDVENLCHKIMQQGMIVEPANYNCEGQLVISGQRKAVDEFMSQIKGKAKAIKLNVSAPFHCSLMAPASEKLKPHLDQIVFHKRTMDVVANVDAQCYEHEYKDKLLKQIYKPVLFKQSLLKLASIDEMITCHEMGAKVLSGFVKKTSPQFDCKICFV